MLSLLPSFGDRIGDWCGLQRRMQRRRTYSALHEHCRNSRIDLLLLDNIESVSLGAKTLIGESVLCFSVFRSAVCPTGNSITSTILTNYDIFSKRKAVFAMIFFPLVWLTLAYVWTFSVYNKVQFDHPKSPDYCDHVLYRATLAMLMLTAALYVACCISFGFGISEKPTVLSSTVDVQMTCVISSSILSVGWMFSYSILTLPSIAHQIITTILWEK